MSYDDRKDSSTRNPDTGAPEDPFRAQVRDALGLDWSTRDAAIFAELKRLKKTVDALEENQLKQRRIAAVAYQGQA